MKFSIIIPIYNVEAYLRECVDSVFSQTFDDYEVILVNDGSTDNSGIICDEYAKKYKNVNVIHTSNSGSSNARNVGTAAAKGDYIVYIDSDDYITDKSFLQDINDKLCQNPTDIVLYKFAKKFDTSDTIEKCTFSLSEAEKTDDSDELLLKTVSGDAYYGSAWTKAFKKSLVQENNIEFEKGLLGEDMEWYFHLLMHAKTLSAIDKVYIAYRQRAGSISKTNGIKNLTDYIYVLEKWSKNIKTADMSDIKRQALMGALAKYYANLLIVYARVQDKAKKREIKRVKALSYLLKFNKSKRPQLIYRIYSLLGFRFTIFAIKMIDRTK